MAENPGLYEASPLFKISQALGVEWPAIRDAYTLADKTVASIQEQLTNGSIPPDTSLVVFGSVARGETTSGSDVDWSLLVDGQTYRKHLQAALHIEVALKNAGCIAPAFEGTFGQLAFGHELVHYIGGSEDSNANMTRRILLLLESRSIGDAGAYGRIKNQVLRRYVDEDFTWMKDPIDGQVPRFLLNDIARYWRTVAVDFAHKRRLRQQRGWALRTVKLRLSRKLTYVAGLLACYSCAAYNISLRENYRLELTDHLSTVLEQTPLEMVASSLMPYLETEAIGNAARELFESYQEFLSLLNDREAREKLSELPAEEVLTDELYGKARRIGHRFQEALNTVFLDDGSTPFQGLTRKYGVF